jgi:Uma2 family endonuclease
MRAILHLPRRSTYAEYLSVEHSSAHRHEFIDGVIVAMADGSDEHNALAARLTYCLVGQLPAGSRYYAADQRYWIAASARGRYADGSVICGKPDHPGHDAQASTNPVIVIEVASPSSEGSITARSARTSRRSPRSRRTLSRARTRARSSCGGASRGALGRRPHRCA